MFSISKSNRAFFRAFRACTDCKVKNPPLMPPFPVLDIDEAFDPTAVEEVEFFLWYGFLRPKSRRIRIVVMCEDGGKQSMAAVGKLR